MSYFVAYFKIAVRHFASNPPSENWKVETTNFVLSLFWLIDIPFVFFTRTVFHERASDLWFENGILELAIEDDKRWLPVLLKSILIVVSLQ